MNLSQLSLSELSNLFQEGKYSSREITESFIESIKSQEKNINAFTNTTFDLAREMADAADARRNNGTLLSPLDGMPIALKDVVCTQEAKTTASSNMLINFQPPYDATVWKKLKEAGCVLLGKNNTDEFTMGSSTETSAFGVTKNPHNTDCVSGGSSGGSAAAVAADMCAFSIGTDTGGSIRQPASFCGVTGLKVSYGRVSRFGCIPMASSLDTIGPLAKTAKDCAMIMDVIAGQDPKDGTTLPNEKLNFSEGLDDSLDRFKIGIPAEYFPDELNPEIRNVLDSAKEVLKMLGVEIVDISLPHTKYGVPTYYVIASSEISANMARYDGIRFGEGKPGKNIEEIYTQTRDEGFGDEVKRRIALGTFALSSGYADEFYKKAQKVRTLIKEDFDKAFESVDAILCPVSPSPAFKIGEKSKDPVEMYLEDIFSIPASLAGICGISIPFGISQENLPIGIQLIGNQMEEGKILQIAHQMQETL